MASAQPVHMFPPHSEAERPWNAGKATWLSQDNTSTSVETRTRFSPALFTHTRPLTLRHQRGAWAAWTRPAHTDYCRFPAAQSCRTLAEPHAMDCSPPGSSVHGILQARILEWVAISFSRGSSPPSHQPGILHWKADSLLLSHLGSPHRLLPFLQLKTELNSPQKYLTALFSNPGFTLELPRAAN